MCESNPLSMQTNSIPGLMEEIFRDTEASARQAVSTPDIFSTRQITLFGSGDSYNAALGASFAFARLAGIDAHAVTSMQASRYVAGFLQEPAKNILAVGISNSGEAARTVEAMTALRHNGARTLALTGVPSSRMAQNADAVFAVRVPPFIPAPGVRGYAGAQMALYLLAIRFAEVKGHVTMDEASALRKQIYAYREDLQAALSENVQAFKEFASLCGQTGRIELLGAGSCRSAADFGAAKAIEAVGIIATSQDIEEFAHINFFFNDPERIPTILFAPHNARSIRRSLELAQTLVHQKRPVLIVTSGQAFQGYPAIRLPEGLPEEFFPLFASVIAAAVIAHIKVPAGNEYFRGHKGLWSEEGLPNIRSSELIVD